MRCLCWFLLAALLLLIFVPISVFIGFCTVRAHHPKHIHHEIRLKSNSTILSSNLTTSTVSSTQPVAEKEDDLSNKYIEGSFIGGEDPVSDNLSNKNESTRNKFRTKNDLSSESKMKLAQLVTSKPLKVAREPNVNTIESKESDYVKGSFDGGEIQKSNDKESMGAPREKESKRGQMTGSSEEVADSLSKKIKAVRVPDMKPEVSETNLTGSSEESAERYLIEDPKNSTNETTIPQTQENSKKVDHDGSTEQVSDKVKELADEPEKLAPVRSERTIETTKKIGKSVNQSEEYDEMEEEELIVKKKKKGTPKNNSDN